MINFAQSFSDSFTKSHRHKHKSWKNLFISRYKLGLFINTKRSPLTPKASMYRTLAGGHTNVISSIAACTARDLLISAGYDRKVTLWRISTGEMLRTIEMDSNVSALATSETSLAVGSTKSISIYDLEDLSLEISIPLDLTSTPTFVSNLAWIEDFGLCFLNPKTATVICVFLKRRKIPDGLISSPAETPEVSNLF